MPYLPPEVQEVSVLLYPTKEKAAARVGALGSGFLLGVDSEANPTSVHLYAVTNDHVTQVAPVIRISPSRFGAEKVIDASYKNWIAHEAGDDVAAYPLGVVRKTPRSSHPAGVPIYRGFTPSHAG